MSVTRFLALKPVPHCATKLIAQNPTDIADDLHRLRSLHSREGPVVRALIITMIERRTQTVPISPPAKT
jgi:hypothetical protein